MASPGTGTAGRGCRPMSTIADTESAGPVSIELAEAASAHLIEQVERVRQVISEYRAVMGAPPFDNDND